MNRIDERALARIVVQWLQAQHWDVYQEVQAHHGGKIADIVAVQGPLSWIVECKRSANLHLLEQCVSWLGRSHYISAAVPACKGGDRGRAMFREVAQHYGIGVLEISPYGDDVYKSTAPRLNRSVHRNIRDSLVAQHKTFAEAGNPNAKRWTPFQETCREVARAVHKNPGMTMKELIHTIRHHYSSDSTARSCLLLWLRQGYIEGVRLDESRPLRVFPKPANV